MACPSSYPSRRDPAMCDGRVSRLRFVRYLAPRPPGSTDIPTFADWHQDTYAQPESTARTLA